MKFTSVAAALLAGLGITAAIEVPQVFENVEVQQTFDLTSTYVKRSVVMEVENVSKEPQDTYYVPVEPELKGHVAVMEARQSKLEDALVTDFSEDEEYYVVTLAEPVAPGEKTQLMLAQALTSVTWPMPEQGNQDDKQFMVFKGPKYAVGAYPSKKQETKARGVTSMEELEGGDGKVENALLTYGPYKKVKPMASESFIVRYENPRPLVDTSRLSREVWISHWGESVSFEETYWMKNFGTKLKQFSRLDYQRPQSNFNLNVAALKEFFIQLKPGTRDVYYVDLVGNVSTSHFRQSDGKLEMKPRYPMFGGWGYNFTVGWSLGIEDFVKKVDQSGFYLAKIPFIEGPQDMAYQDVELTVVLPEGATHVDALSLFGAEPEHDVIYSFLDTVGRPTLKLRFNNIIDGHRRGEIYVTYKYTMWAHLTKPLSIAAKLVVFFAVTLGLSRINIGVSNFKSKKD